MVGWGDRDLGDSQDEPIYYGDLIIYIILAKVKICFLLHIGDYSIILDETLVYFAQ